MSASHFEGIPVLFCFPGSPAAKAGVREGDRLLIVNGVRMANILDFVRARAQDARRITLTLMRGNTIHDAAFDLEAWELSEGLEVPTSAYDA